MLILAPSVRMSYRLIQPKLKGNVVFMKQDNPKKPRGIYLFPNLLTTAGLFAAYFAVVAALKGRFEIAAIAIFVAMVWDAFDGRVARLTHTESAFGAEYDSLCDMVSFGVAPALVVYSWSIQSLGKLGWLASFIYTAATALRLARFNTQIGISSKRYFQGLPCPSAAAVIAGMVWFCSANDIRGVSINIAAAVITIILGVLMVSNVRYYSFKDMDLKGKVPFIAVVLVVLIFACISINPPLLLLATFSLYALSGPILTLFRMRHKQRKRRRKQS